MTHCPAPLPTLRWVRARGGWRAGHPRASMRPLSACKRCKSCVTAGAQLHVGGAFTATTQSFRFPPYFSPQQRAVQELCSPCPSPSLLHPSLLHPPLLQPRYGRVPVPNKLSIWAARRLSAAQASLDQQLHTYLVNKAAKADLEVRRDAGLFIEIKREKKEEKKKKKWTRAQGAQGTRGAQGDQGPPLLPLPVRLWYGGAGSQGTQGPTPLPLPLCAQTHKSTVCDWGRPPPQRCRAGCRGTWQPMRGRLRSRLQTRCLTMRCGSRR